MKRLDRPLVVAADDPVATITLLRVAAGLTRSDDAAITLMAVVAGPGRRLSDLKRKPLMGQQRNAMVQARLRELTELTSGLNLNVEHVVAVGSPQAKVSERVTVFGHDLVVVAGRRGISSNRRSKGSLATHLLRKCPVPVWIQPASAAASDAIAVAIGPLGVSSAVERFNVQLLELAGSLAAANRCRLHVIHAWRLDGDATMSGRRLSYPSSQMEGVAKQVVTEARAELGWLIDQAGLSRSDLRVHMRYGYTLEVVVQAMRDIGPWATIVGTQARSGVPGVLVGNTAERIIGAAPGAVLAVKPEGSAATPQLQPDWHPTMLPY